MSRFATSFSFGFATAALVGAALLIVMKPAQATETSLADWMRMSPDAKLAHAREVAPDRSGMEHARAILFCLHDMTVPAAYNPSDVGLNAAVHRCQEKLGAVKS